MSSGRYDRHRLHRGGNRQLNRALHVIAITRGRIDPETRAYLARKEAEGKSRIEAMRCLKAPSRTPLPPHPLRIIVWYQPHRVHIRRCPYPADLRDIAERAFTPWAEKDVV